MDMASTTAGPPPASSDQEEDLGWQVDDQRKETIFNDSLGCLQTTMPVSKLVIGWDICGCGRPVVSCGCEVITLAEHVRKMRERELKQEALERLEKAAPRSAVVDNRPKIKKSPRGREAAA